MYLNLLFPVLESNKEIEQVLLVKPKDYKQIEKLAYKKETMEQWEVKSAAQGPNLKNRKGRGSIRVRAINDKEYILTSKSYHPDGISADEIEQKTTKEMFDIFKKICPMGSRKTRFYIKSERYTIEVDVYYNNGKPVEWCKVDIELKNKNQKIDDLPFDILEPPITNERTPEQDEFAAMLFQKMFQMYNYDSIHPIDTGV